jgi:hypothetical protein
MSTHTANEKRVRRLADREGYRLQKLRGEDAYLLFSIDPGGLVVGEAITSGVYVGYGLDAIEDWLRND